MISIVPSLSEMLCLYDRGLYLQAHAAGRALGPLAAWQGTEARLIAGRLAVQFGGRRLSHRLMRRAWRDDLTHPEARYIRARARDDEALALLTKANERIECAAIAGQLTLVQTEMHRWEDARRSLDRFEALAPLIEKEGEQWLAGRRSDVAYYCGDLEKAIEYARLGRSVPPGDREAAAGDFGFRISDFGLLRQSPRLQNGGRAGVGCR
jgi:hypothetical protein